MNSAESGRRFYFCLALIVALAAWWRLAGITTEPFWLDEVFTFYLSSGSFEEVICTNARDTHPPLYYLGVAAARQVLGDSETAIRSFSTIWSLLGIVLIMFFGRDLGGLRIAVMAGLLAVVNPLDLYYAQEARMYSQAAALATASSWFVWRWLRTSVPGKTMTFRWGWWAFFYCGTSILLCFTHLVGTMVLLTQGMFFLVFLLWKRRFRQASVFVGIGLTCMAAVAFWASYVIKVRGEFFSQAYLGWIPHQTVASGFRFLVDQFYLAFCGGIPGDVRKYISLLAWLLVLFVLGSGISHSARYMTSFFRKRWAPSLDLKRVFLLWLIIGPVLFAQLTSRLFNPIYYPPRFSLLVLAPFLILIAVECKQLGSKTCGYSAYSAFLVLMAVGSWCQAGTVTKTGMADFAAFWYREGPPDVAVFSPGHNRVMASYYTGLAIQPVTQSSLERKLREEPLTVWVCSSPRASASDDEAGRLAEWVIGLGAHQELGICDGVSVTEVVADPVPRFYPPLPEHRQVNFGEELAEKHLWAGWYHGEIAHQWSRGNRAEFVFALNNPEKYSRITLKMFCFHQQNISIVLNQRTVESFFCENRNPHLHETIVPTGLFKTENTLTFLLPDAIAPNQVSDSRDSRELALGIQWLRMDERQ